MLLPILEATGARATLFLEGRPLVERRVSWSHQFFWLLHRAGQSPAQVVEALLASAPSVSDTGLPSEALRAAAPGLRSA